MSIDHIGLQCSDIAASKALYTAMLAPLGWRIHSEWTEADGTIIIGLGGEQPELWLSGKADTAPTQHLHVAIRVDSTAEVTAFHEAALAAGARDNGQPGPRPEYAADYWAAFVLDADGNNIEAVYRGPF